jgi:formylglycine-generating enzyme required for sulfatase activity
MNQAIQPDLVFIPAGQFLMGENEEDKYANDTERPRHSVKVSAFRLGRGPVTIGEYRRFAPNHEPDLPEDWPVAKVSWEDAYAYCQWLGPEYRLPSEAEWEYAARAGTQTPYPFGSILDTTLANYYYDEQGNKVGPGHRTPAGTYPANNYGIYDMLGNVCEWVQDSWAHTYTSNSNQGNRIEASTAFSNLRVLRGGAWDYLPRLLRCSWRDALTVNCRRDNVGFRIATNS